MWDHLIDDKDQWFKLEKKGKAILSYIIKYKRLDEELIELLMLKLDWYLVFKYQRLSEDFIRAMYPRVCLMYELDDKRAHENFKRIISKNQKVVL